ncbi:MAG: 30S ribosomal protein S7 [Alphaproteobacteria bacterium]|jgi:small subunit ribosomal protein S7|nr:30S ribosomal protein S7 [Alphaproteobacteria bacterium]
MSRRKKINKRDIELDARYKDRIISKFVNVIMLDGKKTRAEKIIYTILDKISKEKKIDAIKFFHDVLNNVKPRVEVRSRRVGGATYQVPMEVKVDRSQALAIRWIIDAARRRGGKNMEMKLYQEFLDAHQNKGGAVKKREDTHKMADANKAFAHFRW